MKKILSITLILLTTLNLFGCSNSNNTETTETTATPVSSEVTNKETVKITALNGQGVETEVEIKFNPERIAILDMAALDIIDALGHGDAVVGSSNVSIDYLKQYNPDDSNGKIINLGTVKTADLEKVAEAEPDVIFIGGRLASVYDDLSAIAPVVYLSVDYSKGVYQSTKENARKIASLFGDEDKVETLFSAYEPRITALKEVINGKQVLLGMYNSNAFSIMDSNSQLNIIVNELGGVNVGNEVGNETKATHGEEASWETIVKLNPEYMFVLDRSTAIGAKDEGLLGAREVIENDLIKELDCYKEGHIVYFIEHANVWYTATGGVQALDVMLSDLEASLLNK